MIKHSNVAIFIPHLGCPHCCSFCDQRTISGNQKPVLPQDAKAIIAAAYEQITDPIKRQNTEIAFFGGSFTAIEPSLMEEFLSVCQPYLGENGFCGIRISTRPDAITPQILDTLQKYGVTAIELGVQSLDDTVLAKNLRGHTAKDAIEAVKFIKGAEYKFSLGLQMMVGLYGESKESLYRTAQTILALAPDTLRIYPTVVLKGTKLDALLQSGEYVPMSLSDAVEFTAEWMEKFEAAGIRLIKVGLHASDDVEEKMTGGIYHPAFRELCESRIYRKKIESLLSGQAFGSYILYLPKRDISKAAGQKRENLIYFEKAGYRIKLKGTEDDTMRLERDQIR